jgi:hypothetical protein
MEPLRVPTVDFALFPMSCAAHNRLLGWEVTMLDTSLFEDASHTGREQRARSLPLLIGEVTELLEGALLELVARHRLTLWLPIAYAYLDDDDWIEALMEQVSRPKGSVEAIALIVRWQDLPAGLQRLRRNVDRLRKLGLHAIDTAHAPLALAAGLRCTACEANRLGRPQARRAGSQSTADTHEVEFGAAVSLSSVFRQLN